MRECTTGLDWVRLVVGRVAGVRCTEAPRECTVSGVALTGRRGIGLVQDWVRQIEAAWVASREGSRQEQREVVFVVDPFASI